MRILPTLSSDELSRPADEHGQTPLHVAAGIAGDVERNCVAFAEQRCGRVGDLGTVLGGDIGDIGAGIVDEQAAVLPQQGHGALGELQGGKLLGAPVNVVAAERRLIDRAEQVILLVVYQPQVKKLVLLKRLALLRNLKHWQLWLI